MVKARGEGGMNPSPTPLQRPKQNHPKQSPPTRDLQDGSGGAYFDLESQKEQAKGHHYGIRSMGPSFGSVVI